MANAILHSMKGAEGRKQRIENSIQYVQRFENSNVAQQMLDLYTNLL